MNLHDLVSQLLVDSKASVGVFLPEIVISTTIVLVLLLRLTKWGRHLSSNWIALVGSLVALGLVVPWDLLSAGDSIQRMEIFTGMLVYDGLSVFMRALVLLFLSLFFVFISLSGVPDREDRADVSVLLLGATLGFCLMISANHMLMVFMAIEMASVPSYVLAGMLRRKRVGSEAALKYAVYGAGAAGIMLYGISLLAGLVNAVHLPTVAIRLAERVPSMDSPELMVLALALMMITVGLAFKLSAVPFHFWCPDVFEGAPAEVGAFLSVASKAAALTLLLRVVVGVGWIAPEGKLAGEVVDGGADVVMADAATSAADGPVADGLSDGRDAGLFSVSDSTTAAPAFEPGVASVGASADVSPNAAANSQLEQVRFFMARLIALLAAITCTFGNLAAYGQKNIKRMLAYSTIAHAGYMMMAIPAVLELVGHSTHGAQNATASLAMYVSVYLFMNLGAFAIVALLRDRMQSDQIASYAGLLRSSPGIAICFSIILFGLVGLPPLSGFLGKFAIFAALTDAFRASGGGYLMALLLIAGVNSAISLFYYLRVVRLMTMESAPEQASAARMPLLSPKGFYVLIVTLPTALLIVVWEPLNAAAFVAARSLFG